jgi:hypothetical protein
MTVADHHPQKINHKITIALLLIAGSFLLAQSSPAEVTDIDDGAPETLDDEIRRSAPPPEYAAPTNDPSQQPRRGPYVYNGYPYPFIYPFSGAVTNVNPPIALPNGRRP